ncbi:hypothetical protein [Gordonia sp. NPDC003376]
MNTTVSLASTHRFRTLLMADSPLSVVIGTPDGEPVLWHRYLQGARDAYTRHGCAAALDYEQTRGGESTAIFCAVLDARGRVVGGLRIQDRLETAASSHALVEWSGQDSQVDLVNEIEERLADGIVEVKSAWVDERSEHAAAVAPRLSRLALVVMQVCGVRYIMATSAEHVLARWVSGGGRVAQAVAPTPYPDERYVTRLMWIDRTTLASDARPDIWEQVRREMAGLQHYDEVARSA